MSVASIVEALYAMDYLFRHHVLSDLEMAQLPDGTVAKVRLREGYGNWWTARIQDGMATDISRQHLHLLCEPQPPTDLDDLDVVVLPDDETLSAWLAPFYAQRAATAATWDTWRA